MTILKPVATGVQPPSTTPATTLRPITPPNEPPIPPRRSPWTAKHCPTCRTALDGGPVHFRCASCGKAVMAADLDTESHRPLVRIDRPAGVWQGRDAA
ncbi:hypothetical protein ACGFNU_00970 [Spirillospora sp. NPDC048911]|uniref:hypothetical protein n=1 Tax=Spirillospora sp. NPDC048911 TaxID=3364527 RepID=UPI003714BCE9